MQDYKMNRSSVDTNYIIGNVAMETYLDKRETVSVSAYHKIYNLLWM